MQKSLLAQFRTDQASNTTETNLQACGSVLFGISWLRAYLDTPMRVLLQNWPSAEEVAHLHSIRDLARTVASGTTSEVAKHIGEYFVETLVERGTMNPDARVLVKTLLNLWQRAPDLNHRLLALSVVQGHLVPAKFRYTCLAQLPELSDGVVINLHSILNDYDQGPAVACLDLTSLLASATEPTTCWKLVLTYMVETQGQTLMDYALTNLKAYEWMHFLGALQSVHAECDPRNPSCLLARATDP